MVQIFDAPGYKRDPLLENLMMNLPGQVAQFQKDRQERKAMGDLAEQLGLFDDAKSSVKITDEQEGFVQSGDGDVKVTDESEGLIESEGITNVVGEIPKIEGVSQTISERPTKGLGIDRKTFDSLPPESRQALIQETLAKRKREEQELVNQKRTRAYEKASGLPQGTFEGLDDQGAQKLALEFVKARQSGQKLPDDVKNYLVESQKSVSEVEAISPVIDRLKVLVDEGAADPRQVMNGLAKIPGLSDLANPGSSEFESGSALLIEKFKNAIGGRITQVEFENFKNKLPRIGLSRAANKQLLDLLSKGSDIAKRRRELINQVRMQNDGIAPPNIDIIVEDQLNAEINDFRNRMNDFGNETSQDAVVEVREGFTAMRNPQTGEEFYIRQEQVEEAKKAGWESL